ncbi:MAG: (Fe-S)-binding protein, partial [Actinomycetota bacterium]|nr:(Fe-S)-binding protein [Actinomycetota bacterium]
YSGTGRMSMGLSMLKGRSELSEEVAEIIYRCQLCGACDVSCKVYRDDIDLSEVLMELRASCVEGGQLIADHMLTVDALKRENNVFGEPRSARAAWADGLGLKDTGRESAKVLLHTGCRYSYDTDLWPALRQAARLLQGSGVDVGIAGVQEACCGGRVYELGYQGDAANFADDMISRVKASGADMVVTACSDCFAAFHYLYPRMGKSLGVEVMHMSEFMQKLIGQGRIDLPGAVPMRVTYHDPCHLGRMGEPYLAWNGDKLKRPQYLKRTGRRGVYDAPRAVLSAISELELTEMERIREYSWCCGAGGGVLDAFPEFASWTARERLDEAAATGADALVTACPWCVRIFRDAVEEHGLSIRILELTELVAQAAGMEGEDVT